MTQFGKAAIALAISAAMMANVPIPAKANDNGSALAVLLGAVVVGAAIAHATSAPRPAKRTVVVQRTVVVTQKCHNEALPVLNSAGKQIAIQEKRVCD